MNESLNALYHPLIRQHNNEPYHFEKKENAAYIIEANNPLCGDRFRIFLEISDGKISSAHFHGYGCAVSKAATSFLTQSIENQSLENAFKLCQYFLKMLENSEINSAEKAEYIAFSAVRNFPERKKCVTLSWEELLVFLETAS
jgi:nitrogen fixation NifU-like protein